MKLSSNATSLSELREEIVSLLLLRAKQQEDLARTVHLGSQAAALRLNAAQNFENVAKEIAEMDIANGGVSDTEMPWCEQCQCWHHVTAEHVDFGKRGEEYIAPVRPIDRRYDGQAHHMAKAAQSLVLMLTDLDYARYSTDDASWLTTSMHSLINFLEKKQIKYICKHCGMFIRETRLGRIRNEWEHLDGMSFCHEKSTWAWPKEESA